MVSSSSAPTATKSRFMDVRDYPDGEGTYAAKMAELQATGMIVLLLQFPRPLTDTMKQELAMATEVLLPALENDEEYSQHVVTELMKLYNAGVKICVVEIPKNFPHGLMKALDETLPELITEKDESGTGRLRRLKVYFMMEV